MSQQEGLTINLTKDEALVLFEFSARTNQVDCSELFEDQAELKMLWRLEGQLERQLAEPFNNNYLSLVAEARNRLRDEEQRLLY